MKTCVFLALLSTAYAATAFDQQCTLKVDRGRCNLNLKRWYFNAMTRECKQFYYGGCDGNENRFDDKKVCEKICMDAQSSVHELCLRPAHRGPCQGSFPRFYYDKSTQSCHPFLYGGCQSNGNNFESYVSCINFCKYS